MQHHILFKFVEFRLRQAGRFINDIGMIRILVAITLFIGFSLFELTKLLPEKKFLWILVYLLPTLPIHLVRKDYLFLRKLDFPIKWFMALEYNLIALPFTFFLLYYKLWDVIMLGHITTTLLVFIPSVTIKKERSENNRVILWIPEYLFEWRCYLRQHKYFFLAGYLIAVVLSFYLYTVPIWIFIVSVSIPMIFGFLEPKEMIETYPKSSTFLWSKMKDHSFFIHVLFLPLYLLFMFFHYSMWYILIFSVLILQFSLCFCLVYKYSRFQSSTKLIYNQIPFAIFLIATILFLPIGFLFIYLYWKKAQETLPEYA